MDKTIESTPIFKKAEEYGHYDAAEGCDMVPLYGLTLEYEGADYGEDRE